MDRSRAVVLWSIAVYVLTFALATSVPESHRLDEPPNPQHIFNAIHSSMRQWGSSLNHNGMSYFLATVPRGVQLYHGTTKPDKIEGMEWLAFEPEHATLFALRIRPPGTASALPPELRLKRAWHEAVVDFSKAPSTHTQLDLHPQQRPPPGHMPRLEPGWLHTYATNRDLRLLYLDGQSAAKNDKGTLDSQDAILLRGVFNSSGADIERARHLCQITNDRWQSKIDGFLRMEHGFEIILCDFANLKLLAAIRTKKRDLSEQPNESQWEANLLNLFRAVSARYAGIGGRRVILNYDQFVSAFAVPGLDLFTSSVDLPRLNNISSAAAANILESVDDLVINSNSSRTPLSIDWQAIADEVVERYGKRLKYLVSGALLEKKRLDAEIELILQPFIDFDNRDAAQEVRRCTYNFMPHGLEDFQTASLAARAVLSISNKICRTLHGVMEKKLLEDSLAQIQELIQYLAWPTWKYCSPECGLDQVCVVAIWPFGSVGDHFNPSCRNGTGINLGWGYWWEDTRKM